jgi:hypothetical protein
MTVASRLDLAVEAAERQRCQRALEAVTAALEAATHDFAPLGEREDDSCDWQDDEGRFCCGRAADAVHQTPDVVRARHGLGAT